MNGLNLSNITDAKIGGTQVNALYLGSNKIWELIQNRINYEKQYFTIEALADNCAVRLLRYGSSSVPTPAVTVKTSTDGGSTWFTHNISSASSYYYYTFATLSKGQKLLISSNIIFGNLSTNSTSNPSYRFSIYTTNDNKMYGNINSLIKGDDFYKNYNLKDGNYTAALAGALRVYYSNYKNYTKDISNVFCPDYTTASGNNAIYYRTFNNLSAITKAPMMEINFDNNSSTSYGYKKYFCCLADNDSLADLSNVIIYAYKYNVPQYCFYYGFSNANITIPPKIFIRNAEQYAFGYAFNANKYTDFSINLLGVSQTTAYDNWLNSTDSLTTLKVNGSMTTTATNTSTLKAGKTIATSNYYDPFLFTIESLEDNNVIKFKHTNSDNISWILYKNGSVLTTQVFGAGEVTLATLNKGEVLQIKSNREIYRLSTENSPSYFSSTGKFNVSGYLNSLLIGDYNSSASTSNYSFAYIFKECKVVDARYLIFDNISNNYSYLFYYMFYGCTDLERAPRYIGLATDQNYLCNYMFMNCTSLYEGPEILVSSLGSSASTNAFKHMFNNCENLEYVGLRFTSNNTSLGEYTCVQWLYGTTPSKLHINSNMWDTSAGRTALSSYNNSKIPNGTTLINHKFKQE
jgi:hypothetical protein